MQELDLSFCPHLGYLECNFAQTEKLDLSPCPHLLSVSARDGRIKSLIAKDNPDIFDYKVDPKLKELCAKKDYGSYANEKGQLPVCFIASNHTTGGNSGSPVINADGELIGINFDRVWEGTMSDINYDVDRCRNISLDVRYFLFIVDKFANAQNIIKELDIRR